jgi:hypothetical protein
MPPDFERVIRSLAEHGAEFVIVGATAAIAQGAPIATIDLDLGYRRTRANVERMVRALQPFRPRLRGVPESVPFTWGVETVLRGCNFTLVTDAGDVDLLGYITGVGDYAAMTANAFILRLFDYQILTMGLEEIIRSKKAAGRPKDKAVLPVLEETLHQRGRKPQ